MTNQEILSREWLVDIANKDQKLWRILMGSIFAGERVDRWLNLNKAIVLN